MMKLAEPLLVTQVLGHRSKDASTLPGADAAQDDSTKPDRFQSGVGALQVPRPYMSNCSGCSDASDLTMIVLPVSSSRSFSHLALLPFNCFATSGLTRSMISRPSN